MKRIMIAIASLALLAGLASCQKEGTGKEIAKQTEEVEIVQVNLTASFLKTRVSYAETDANNLQPSWEEGDKIFCTADGTTFYPLTVGTVDLDGSASISGEGPGNGPVALLFYKNGLENVTPLPLSIDYTGQSGDKTMPNVLFASGIITDGTGTFEFKSAGSVVGVSYAKSLAGKTIKSVKIEGKNLSGAQVTYASNAFTLTATQNDSDAITTADLTSKNITVKSNGEFIAPVFIAVPAGATISKVTVTSTENVTDTKDLSSPKTVEANQYLYVKAPEAPEAPEGAIANGRFTINPNGDQVFFSQGNLKYDKGTDWNDGTWCFFGKQYDCDPGTGGKYAADYISLFTWGYNATNSINPEDVSLGNSSVTNYGVTFLKTEDWGSQVGDGNTWRTLTTAEWQYLFGDTDERKSMYAYGVTVRGSVNCVVLYPDGYLGEKVDNGDTTSYVDEAEYLAATAEGVVFLPAAGIRRRSDVYDDVGSGGYYWSSTASGGNAFGLFFYSGGVSIDDDNPRNLGFSVRLVSDCNK